MLDKRKLSTSALKLNHCHFYSYVIWTVPPIPFSLLVSSRGNTQSSFVSSQRQRVPVTEDEPSATERYFCVSTASTKDIFLQRNMSMVSIKPQYFRAHHGIAAKKLRLTNPISVLTSPPCSVSHFYFCYKNQNSFIAYMLELVFWFK